MNRSVRLSILVLLIIIASLAVNSVVTQTKITEKEYAGQVLDQYIKYYCPTAGTCARKKALEKLRRDWPHVYKLGFQALENDKEDTQNR